MLLLERFGSWLADGWPIKHRKNGDQLRVVTSRLFRWFWKVLPGFGPKNCLLRFPGLHQLNLLAAFYLYFFSLACYSEPFALTTTAPFGKPGYANIIVHVLAVSPIRPLAVPRLATTS